MLAIYPSVLTQRFNLRRMQYLCERFEKSPNITETCAVADHLGVCYGNRDAAIIPSVQAVLLRMYAYVKDWFDYRDDLAIELWMAPAAVDLQYMTCLPCDRDFACAPGSRDGKHIILLASPLSGGRNRDRNRFSSVLAHEIAHHVIADISRATAFTMQRKERLDVPMWLEEGLCQLIQGEVNPALQAQFAREIAGTTEWFPLESLWNDLSDCEDVHRAYLQAYKEARALVEKRGKADVVRSLYLNRTHSVDWKAFPEEDARR